MILALDVHYKEDSSAKSVGVLFEWDDDKAQQVLIEYIYGINDYVPGEFYKRELPCLLKIIETIDLNSLEAIIVDGYIYVDNLGKFGLGGILWETLNQRIPVIGLAKTSFHGNKETVKEILRGESKNPLFVSSIGFDLNTASERVKNMKGDYRIPTLLKEMDVSTKTE